MNKILLVGATSLIGKAIIDLYSEKFHIVGTTNASRPSDFNEKIILKNLDIRKSSDVKKLFSEHTFSHVIHTASIGDIDLCELKKHEALKVNVEGTSNIVLASKQQEAKVIFISSSAVFNGKCSPYKEEDDTCPVNYYGETKIAAEKIVVQSSLDNVVLRIPLMYGWNNSDQRKNIVTWILEQAAMGKELELSEDRTTNPVFNEDVAIAIIKLIESNHSGVFHLGGPHTTNRFEIGRMVLKFFDLDEKYIKKSRLSGQSTYANRAQNESLDITKTVDLLKCKPRSIKEALKIMRSKETAYFHEYTKRNELEILKKAWKLKQENMPNISQKNVGSFIAYFNSIRAKHLTDQAIDPISKHEEFDYFLPHNPLETVFCKPEAIDRQKIGHFKLKNFIWDILANISPINEFHSLVIPRDTECNQHLTFKFVEDMLELSKLHNNIFIGFNSWGAGASQNHFHSHIFFSEFPVVHFSMKQTEKEFVSQPEDYPIVLLVFSSFSKDRSCLKLFFNYVQELMDKKIPYNVLFHNSKMYLVPRRQERDASQIKKGVDAVFGMLPVTSMEHLEKYEHSDAIQVLKSVGFENLELNNFLYGIAERFEE